MSRLDIELRRNIGRDSITFLISLSRKSWVTGIHILLSFSFSFSFFFFFFLQFLIHLCDTPCAPRSVFLTWTYSSVRRISDLYNLRMVSRTALVVSRFIACVQIV